MKMNLLLICLDTFRRDCIGALGDRGVETPRLDAMARKSVVFENAFGEGQPTIEFRRGLLTGVRTFPWRFDYDTRGLWPSVRGWHKVSPEDDMISEILLENGYTTGFFSDTYHMFKPTQNFTRGYTSWDFIRGQESDNWRSGPLDGVDLDRYLPPRLRKGGTAGRPPTTLLQYLLNNRDRTGEEDWTSARAFAGGMRFLEDNRDNEPFFLYIDSFDPHEPWDPPRRYADRYDPDWDEDWEPIHLGGIEVDKKTRRRIEALYYGECTFVDEWIGRLLDRLEELGLAENTLVVITSDHGTELWDHGIVGKGVHGCRYRHNAEIILMMRLPPAAEAGTDTRGRRIPAMVQNHDILPTVLGLMGIAHRPVDGIDLRPLITGEKERIRDVVISGWLHRAMVRSERFSYSVNFEADFGDEHLFDLAADPAEAHNAASQCPEACSELRSRLEDFLGERLPAAPRDKIYVSDAPIQVWSARNEAAAEKLGSRTSQG
jgi:arylsulfatase A-like enzyme